MVHGPIYGRFMGFYVNGFLCIERIQILIFRMLRTQQCRCSPMLIFRGWTTCAYIEVVLRRFRSILPVYLMKKSWKWALFWFRSRSAFIKTCWASVPFESWGEDAKGLEYSTIKADIHEGFCSRSMLQAHFACVSTHEGAFSSSLNLLRELAPKYLTG